MHGLTAEEQLALIKENTIEIIAEDELLEKLERSVAENRPLRCKLGIDPSAPDLHLGHAVVLHKLRLFQELGHHVILILGDFTGRVGDPTGRDETRPQLTEAAVLENARTYREQIFHVLDPERVKLCFNSEWLAPLNFSEIIRLASTNTVARMLEREDFSRRLRENRPIGIHEFFYPLMQGYDSVAIQADIELGATEQKFNLLMGRHLQREYGQEAQVALTMPILVGTDGVHKMSKSLGNYIGITEPAEEIYGKVMSIADTLMPEYYRLATTLSPAEINKVLEKIKQGRLHPRDAKMRLAREITGLYHGAEAARKAEDHFCRVFQRREVPTEMTEVELKLSGGSAMVDLVPLLFATGLVSSNSEARRMIRQGAVRVDGEQVQDINYQVAVPQEMVLQVGRRRFARVRFKD